MNRFVLQSVSLIAALAISPIASAATTVNPMRTYKNEKLGFSISIPKKALNWYAVCKVDTVHHEAFIQDKVEALSVYTSADAAFIGPRMYYGFKENVPADSDDRCLRVLTSRTWKKGEPLGWTLHFKTMKDEDALRAFIRQTYGYSCSVEKTPATQAGVFALSLAQDATSADQLPCPVQYSAALYYQPSTGRLAYWDMGQEGMFTSAHSPTATVYDAMMVKSFRFTTKK